MLNYHLAKMLARNVTIHVRTSSKVWLKQDKG